MRIQIFDDKFNEKLDHVTLYLFPEVDHITWSKILIFVFSGYDPKHRVKSIIDRPWNFGTAGRGKVYSGSPGEGEESWKEEWRKDLQLELNNTFELAIKLFGDIFSIENLNRYIKELEGLKKIYEKDSSEDNKRKRLLSIFEEMLNYLNQQQNNLQNNTEQ